MEKLPMYKQIQSFIISQIKQNSYKPDEMIPSESQLIDKFNVSKMTVRKAIDGLVNNGYLYTKQGKGTYVDNSKLKKFGSLDGSFKEFIKKDVEVTYDILSFTTEEMDYEMKTYFQIESSDMSRCERICKVDNIPFLYDIIYNPKEMFPDIDGNAYKGNFYDYIEESTGKIVDYTTQDITAIKAGEIGKYLEVDEEYPIICIDYHAFFSDGRVFEYGRKYFRTDYHKLIGFAYRTKHMNKKEIL